MFKSDKNKNLSKGIKAHETKLKKKVIIGDIKKIILFE